MTAAHDGRAILWDLAGDRRLDRRFSIRGYRDDLDVWYVVDVARGVAVSPDSRTLAVTHLDGTVELLDTATLRRRRAFRAIRGFAGSVSSAPTGACSRWRARADASRSGTRGPARAQGS